MRWFAKLSNVRAQSFEDTVDPALKTPALVVTARFGESKDEDLSETVTFARSGQSVVGSRPDEPGTLKVDAMPLDDILKEQQALLIHLERHHRVLLNPGDHGQRVEEERFDGAQPERARSGQAVQAERLALRRVAEKTHRDRQAKRGAQGERLVAAAKEGP